MYTHLYLYIHTESPWYCNCSIYRYILIQLMHPNMIQQPSNLFLPGFASTWLHLFIFSSHFLRQSRSFQQKRKHDEPTGVVVWCCGRADTEIYSRWWFQICFLSHFGEDFQFDEYFWDGLKPPTRNCLSLSLSKLVCWACREIRLCTLSAICHYEILYVIHVSWMDVYTRLFVTNRWRVMKTPFEQDFHVCRVVTDVFSRLATKPEHLYMACWLRGQRWWGADVPWNLWLNHPSIPPRFSM